MAFQLSFVERLRTVVVPTSTQVLGSLFISLALLTLSQSQSIIKRFGISPAAIDATQNQFQSRLEVILRSPIASSIALLTFWATVGLVAYLICWGIYNLLVEARNEVTLTTAYTNRSDYNHPGHWRGPFETLALKAAAAVGLAVIISSLRYGVSYWLALSAGVLENTSLPTALAALGAVFGLALQLYLVLMFVQLTFTPWYRVKTFTDV
jgi:hypothetical protein